jgi:hypothetical protein
MAPVLAHQEPVTDKQSVKTLDAPITIIPLNTIADLELEQSV